jgi:hypothetical protein
MASDFRFATPLPHGSGIPDVSFTSSPAGPCTNPKTLLFASDERTADGENRFSVHRTDDGYVIHFATIVDFYLTSTTITAHLLDPASSHTVEIHLLGTILSFWMELRGIPMVHASAIVEDDQVIAFLSSSKGGKSCLAAAFAQRGRRILTDDIMPLESRDDHFLARPGFPALRMWPDQAEHFFREFEGLALVHPDFSKRRIPVGHNDFGTFCHEEKPLKVIYLPRRLGPENDIFIEPLSKKQAFLSLIRNSFTAGLVEIAGLQPPRMEFFTRMVQQVPVRRLSYPEGYGFLPRVVDAVLEDSASL